MSLMRPVISPRRVGAVAAVEPTVVNEVPRFGLVVEISPSRRRTAEFEPSLLPFGEFVTGLVHNAYFMTRQRLAASYDFEQFRIAWICRLGQAMSAELFPVDLIYDRKPPERRECESD